ncbi:OmpP1/FadL family transporter [Paludibacterium sp. B53371]|uniref:OmpP1/FadL family transporter n=1 Tax=Paludibacterium sp. B53371 TaxID=2806263 RepID=UPI00207B7BE5|nr:outer membrane protein transport protein [Paludibacterium sp. B53371]
MSYPQQCLPRLRVGMLALLLSGSALASGYNFGSQSVSAQGSSHANGAEAADASTLYYNPAGMTRLAGDQLSFGMTTVIPQTSYEDHGSTYPVFHGGTQQQTAATGDNGGHFAPSSVTVPSFYLTHQVNDRLHLGFALFVPYGAQLNYGSSWVGRYAMESVKLESVNFNPSLALKLDERQSVALGVSAQYMRAHLQKAVDLAALTPLATQDGQASFSADSWGYGFNLGYLFELDDHTRFGLAYRSRIKQALSGSAHWDFSGNPNFIQTLGRTWHPDSSATTDVTTPASASANFYHDLTDKLAVMGNITWTGHSDMQSITIKLPGTTQGDMVINQQWRDSWLYALGANYKWNERLMLRTGVAYDQSPVSDDTLRHPALPDSDRYWISLGANLRLDKQSSLDFAYSYVFFRDATVNYSDRCAPQAAAVTACTGNGETTRGTYKTSLQLLGLQYNYRF